MLVCQWFVLVAVPGLVLWFSRTAIVLACSFFFLRADVVPLRRQRVERVPAEHADVVVTPINSHIIVTRGSFLKFTSLFETTIVKRRRRSLRRIIQEWDC